MYDGDMSNPEPSTPEVPAMFTATISASDAGDAIARVERRLPAGFSTTGRTAVRSARHLLIDVEVSHDGGDVNDAWVVLTSYGINPSADLGSAWESVLGATA